MKGLYLCKGFFHACAEPVIDQYFPNLKYSAGLIGYGSDVLGYDDPVSTDHMWGPRFYMFLDKHEISKKDKIFKVLSENLPYTYQGFSVNFTEPNPNDNGVQHPALINSGNVNPLIFIYAFDDYLDEQLGISNFDKITPLDWLAFSEHRLLSLVSGRFFKDDLHLKERISKIKFYPKDVKIYLIASNWNIIACEQAFVRRCGDVGDEIGSQIICARIAERLIRLCFLYKEKYAPYSKWFGTAFHALDINEDIKKHISAALSANSLSEREDNIVKAQKAVADLHNESAITDYVDCKIESYFGRNIQVIFAEKLVDATAAKLNGTEFENIPLIGTWSQLGGLSDFSDEKAYYQQIKNVYGVS